MMSDEETLYEKGARNLNEVYAGDVVAMPEGTMPFIDVMARTLFGEVWDRDVLSIRDRRLLLMGVIAAQGQSDIWKNTSKISTQTRRTIGGRTSRNPYHARPLRRIP